MFGGKIGGWTIGQMDSIPITDRKNNLTWEYDGPYLYGWNYIEDGEDNGTGTYLTPDGFITYVPAGSEAEDDTHHYYTWEEVADGSFKGVSALGFLSVGLNGSLVVGMPAKTSSSLLPGQPMLDPALLDYYQLTFQRGVLIKVEKLSVKSDPLIGEKIYIDSYSGLLY